MNRTCAVCGKHVVYDLCNSCFKKWVLQEDGSKVYPEWLVELIRIENHNYWMVYKHPEIPISDFQPISE